MHPVARVFQILFLLGGVAMFGYALDEAGRGAWQNTTFRYECTTRSVGTAKVPRQVEECSSRDARTYVHKTDDVLASSLAGVGLMIGAAAVSVGGARRTAPASQGSGPAASFAPAAHPYGGPASFPTPPGHAPGQGR